MRGRFACLGFVEVVVLSFLLRNVVLVVFLLADVIGAG